LEDKNYHYTRKYIDTEGNIKEYEQTITATLKEDELQNFIRKYLKFASRKARDIKEIEYLLKTFIQYRGYNKKNLNARLYRLEHADEIKVEEKKLIKEIMERQKLVANDLVSLLRFILNLYNQYDEEIKEITSQLQEFNKK